MSQQVIVKNKSRHHPLMTINENITHDAPRLLRTNMAASTSNIPEYEYADVNTKAFHVGSFRSEWLSRLTPRDVSFQLRDEDAFDADFAKEMGIGAETMAELKSVCR